MSGRGRDLFPGHQAGKGDKNRTSNEKAYKENYDQINWHRHDIKIGGPSGPFEGLAKALAQHAIECPECRVAAGLTAKRTDSEKCERQNHSDLQQPAALLSGATASDPVYRAFIEDHIINESAPGPVSTVPPHQHSGVAESGAAGPRKSCV